MPPSSLRRAFSLREWKLPVRLVKRKQKLRTQAHAAVQPDAAEGATIVVETADHTPAPDSPASKSNLCTRCERLSFVLHLQGDCKSLGCKVMDLTTYSPLHSDLVLHSSSLTELEKSAASACHMCSLLLVGIKSASRIPTKPFGHSGSGVHVYFECSTSNPWQVFEEMVAICGGIMTSFPIARVPGIRCADPGFLDTPPSLGPKDLRRILFRAVYLGAEDQHKQLLPGQYYDVFEIKDHTWLVRLATYHKWHRSDWRERHWVARSDFSRCSYPIHADCRCGKGVWEWPLLETFHFGPFGEGPVDILPLIQDWLQVCDQAHTRCQPKTDKTFPARLIEITDWDAGLLRLTKGNACGEIYTTLSYRWGDTASSSYVTNKSNVDTRYDGFLLTSLPRTIRDAIHVTHLLDIRFIWIDAICIIQDSHEDWSSEGARMDQIYTHSYVTISADTSPDTKTGFLEKRDMLGWSTCIHPTLLSPWDGPTPGGSYGMWGAGSTLEKSKLTGTAVPRGPRAICCGVAPAQKLTDTSILGERGWILQERVLSRRILHWSVFEVSWECNELTASERLPAGDGDNHQLWGWTQNYEYQPPWDQFRKVLYPEAQSTDLVWSAVPDEPVMKSEDWHELVREFSRRQLSFTSDRLPAISGLSNAFRKAAGRLETSYYYGLWKETLLYDLCWQRTVTPNTRSGPQTQPGNDITTDKKTPSFSWANCLAPVDFLAPFHLDEAVEGVEILDILDFSNGFPSIVLRGYALNATILDPKRPVNPYGTLEKGLKDAAIFDMPGSSLSTPSCSKAICLSFGIVKRIDGVDVDPDAHGLLGLLLEPVKGGAIDNVPHYRRVGLYDGLRPRIDISKMARMTVSII